jgi:uncharacterized RDD family membrane protein YckC
MTAGGTERVPSVPNNKGGTTVPDDQNLPPNPPPTGDADQASMPPGAATPPPPAPRTPAPPQAPAAPQSPGAPQAPYAAAPPTGIGQPADLITRFLAKLIDSVLIAIVYGIVFSVLVVGLILGAMSGVSGSGFIAGVLSSVILTGLLVGYYAFMESSRGQTVGKMLMKIEVRGPDGQRPTMEQAVKRNAYLAIGLIGIIPIIGTLLAPLLSVGATIAIAVTINSNTATRQGWHDMFADGTSVIKIG